MKREKPEIARENFLLTDGVITLRPPEVADAAAIVTAVQESVAEISPWMDWCSPEYTVLVAEKWLATLPAQWETDVQYALVITDRTDGRILGGTGLNHIHPVHHLANLGYWVRTSATGRGIATRATRLVAQFGVEQLKLLRAEIVVAADNFPSLRVAEKSGTQREGILRNPLTVRAQVLDAAMYSLTPQDFGLSV
jgi:ribosomal-protein-serine acetyltransferase